MNYGNADGEARTAVAGRPTALLVDNDDVYRKVISALLADDGWTVSESLSAEAALAQLCRGEEPDLLVTEIHLGAAMDGWTLGGLVRNQWPKTGLLFMSGLHQCRPHDDHFPAAQLLLRPFRFSEFLTAVAKVTGVANGVAR